MIMRRKGVKLCLAGLIRLLVMLSALAAHATQHPQVFSIASTHQMQQQHEDPAIVEHVTDIDSEMGFQQQLHQHPNLRKRQLLRHRSINIRQAVGRSLQQSANQYTPPKFFISSVKAKVVNTYTWDISREASATAMSLVASGQERKQMGFTLSYSKVLVKREYVIEGSADITNLSGQDSLTLLSLTVFVGTTQTQLVCQSMPKNKYVMQPVQELRCPFRLVLTEDPGAANLAGFVQTVRSRVASDPVPFSFSACASSSAALGATACSVEDVGGCVHVTDGSDIQNRYDDKSGTVLAGNPPRSQLFAVPEVLASSQGPPQTLPTLPGAGATSGSAFATRPTNIADLPDNTWWTRRRLHHLFRPNSGVHRQEAVILYDHSLTNKQGRALLQLPPSNVNPLGNQFIWPVPQITGDRPPVGEHGKPLGAVLPMQICSTRMFQFSMIFGPLLPESCGIYEVQNTAAAAYTDSSAEPVVHKTYFYLTVLCPGSAQDALPTSGLRSLSPDSTAGTASAVTPQPLNGPAQLSFASFQRTEAGKMKTMDHSKYVKSSFSLDRYPLLSSGYSRVVLQAEPAGAGQDGAQAGATDGYDAYEDIPYEEPAPAPTAGSNSDSNSTGSTGDNGPTGSTTPSPPAAVTDSPLATPPNGTSSTGSTPAGPEPSLLTPVPIIAVPIDAGSNTGSNPTPPAPSTSVTDVIASVVPLSPSATSQEPAQPSNLRMSILEAKPTLLTSYSWSLSSKPMVESNQFGNVTYVGCRLKAERAEGMTAQLVVGVVRIGNPSQITDPDAQIIRIKSVAVTAIVASNTEEEPQRLVASADCKGSDFSGLVQLMPWRRTNCSFEIHVSASKEAQTLKALTGTIEATAVVEHIGMAGTTEEVSSVPQPFSFMPVLPSTPSPPGVSITNNTNGTNITEPAAVPFVPYNSSTEAGIQNIAVGSCANFSAGIIIAQELPINTTIEAAAVAELAANGTTLDGRGGKCLTVCGVTQPEWEVPIMAPVAGYTQEQCGTVQVYCVGGIIPDNGNWTGSGRLSPALATVSHEVTISGQCLVPSRYSPEATSGAGSGNPGMLQSTEQTTNGTVPDAADAYNPGDYDNYTGDYNPQDYGVGDSGSAPTPAPDAGGGGGAAPAPDSTPPDSDGNINPGGDPDYYSPDEPEGPDSGGDGDLEPGAAGGEPGGGPTDGGQDGGAPPDEQPGTGGAPGGSNTSTISSAPVFRVKPPIQVLLEGVQLQQIQQFNWTTQLALSSTPAGGATTSQRDANATVQLTPGSATALTLIARYTKQALPLVGKITGTVKVQLNDSAVTPNTIKVDTVQALGVYFLTPCGGIAEANITDCNATELAFPATCGFEIVNISMATRPAGVVMANVSVTEVLGTAAASNTTINGTTDAAMNSTAGATLNGTAVNGPANSTTSANATSIGTRDGNATADLAVSTVNVSTISGSITMTFQSAPFGAVLTEAQEVEVDRCVNVTNSFSLTAAGVTPVMPAGAADASTLPQPVLVPSMQLPGQICGTSELRYELKVGPVSTVAGAGPATASFLSYDGRSMWQAQHRCQTLQLTGASILGGSHHSSTVRAASSTWPVHLEGC